MSLLCDESLIPRLPLPLAQLYRRAHNSHRAKDRKETAYCLWEAAIKLLGSVCVCEFAQLNLHDPRVDAALQNLARPALGHWVGFIRQLLPILRENQVVGFDTLYEALTRKREDLPRLASMDAYLRQNLEGHPGQRSKVQVLEVFARVTQFRNQEVGHGAIGQRDEEFYHQVGYHLLAGAGDLLGRIDLLAGRRLFYLQDLRRDGGLWISHRLELLGDSPRRVVPLTWPSERGTPPVPQAVYLDTRPASDQPPGELCSLQPLVVYDEDQDHLLFLNSQRGSKKTEYLCYHTGEHPQRPDLGGEHRELLRRVLKLPDIDEAQMERWAEKLAKEEAPEGSAPGTDERHRRIGEFELLSEIGRGGQSIVYRALQPSLHREVALKRLLVAGNPNTERHFLREIRALARVDHPNLIKIYTSGVDNEQWFYAMELIEGANLGQISSRLTARSATSTDLDLTDWQDTLNIVCEQARLEEKTLSSSTRERSPHPGSLPDLSLPDAPASMRERLAGLGYVAHIVELMRQVALAADALHQAGVIHRDIKPANIMVDRTGERAVLMDLGLAKLTDGDSMAMSVSMGRGGFVGTLRYASPEQALPQMNVPVDARSDVYSIGATLWELLTLRPLFEAGNANDPQLLRKIQQDDPPLLRSIIRGLHPDLEAIVARTLEKDPARRYQSAAELAADLRRYQNGEPVSIRPVGRLTRVWRYFRRRPLEAVLAVVCLLGLLAVGTIVVREAVNAAAREQIARVNAVSLSAVKRMVALLESDQFKRDPGVQPFREEMLSSLEELTEEMKNDRRASAELADLFLKIGTISRVIDAASQGSQTNSRERALKAFNQAVDLARQVPGDKTLLIRALLRRGELHLDDSRREQGIVDLLEAETLVDAIPSVTNAVLDLRGELNHQLGRASHNQGKHAEAARYYKEARQDRKELLLRLKEASDTSRADLLRARNNLARAHGYLGDSEVLLRLWSDAEESYRTSEELRKELTRDDPRNPEFRFQLARSHGNTANLERERFGQEGLPGIERAILAYEEAGKLQVALVNENKAVLDYRSDAIFNHLNLARLRLFRGSLNPDQMTTDREQIQTHLQQAEELLGSDDGTGTQVRPLRRARSQLALLRAYFRHTQDPHAAGELLTQAERFYRREGEKIDNTESYDLALLEALRGQIERAQGRPQAAEDHDTDALAALARAVELGYRNRAWAEKEPVFASIRRLRPVQWEQTMKDR